MTSPLSAPRSTALRRGVSVRTKMLVVLVPLLVFIGGVLAYATQQASGIRQDIARLREEPLATRRRHREHTIAPRPRDADHAPVPVTQRDRQSARPAP